MFTYLLVNGLSVAVPLAFSFHPRLRFDRNWPAFWPAVLATAGLFIAWDVLYTAWGVWGFNPRYLVGIHWCGLPVEEWLFFVCIPYACVFTYHCFKRLIPTDPLAPLARPLSWALLAGLSAAALLHTDKAYTAVTFAAAAALLLLHVTVLRSTYLGHFYLAYAAILLPFMLVNGTLTGGFTPQPVVWYDDSQNLGLRVWTIPLEDFFYSLLLQLTNVTLYEALLARRRRLTTDAPYNDTGHR